MTKKSKTTNRIIIISGVIGVILVGSGLFTFGGIDPTVLEGFFGFSLIDINSQRLFCNETSCVWNWRSFNPTTTGIGLKEKIDLSLINIDEPIIVNWRVDLKSIEPECEPLLDDLQMSIEVNDGADHTFSTVAGESKSVDISPFITEQTGELEIRIGTIQACLPISEGKIIFTISNGDFPPTSPTITFTKFGAESSMDDVIEEMMGIETRNTVQCFGCRGTVISMVEDERMCPVLDCPSDGEPTPPPVEPTNGSNFPELTIGSGTATIVFVATGAIIIGIVVVAIYIRRKSAPITEF